MGMTQQFLSLVTLTFELGRGFCTMYLTAKFGRPMFSHLEVIVQTNMHIDKQMPPKISTSLRYATPVGKNQRQKNRLVKWLGFIGALDKNE